MKTNVVITGFMGTGKSSVGRLVAERLGLTFVDMDEVIEAREGVPITELFSRHGEAGFRAVESAVARELGMGEGLVIATGGGTMLAPENRAALGENGLIVCLTCAADQILRRLDGDTTRPMLAAPDKEKRMNELLAARMPVYTSLPVVVDTTRRSVAEVAEVVVSAYRGVECKPSKSV